MRRGFFLILFLGFFLSRGSSLLAREHSNFEATKPAGPRKILPENLRKQPEGTAPAAEFPRELQERVGERQEEIREKLSQKKKERIRRIFQRTLKRFEAALSRLENIISRFESRINKISQKRDVGRAWEYLTEAKKHLNLGKIILENLQSKFESLVEVENPREVFVQVKNLVHELKTHLVETHKNLKLGVMVLKEAEPSVEITPGVSPQVRGGENE